MWRYLEQFKEPLILLLLGSSVLSILVGQYEDAFSITAAVIIVGSVAFYQEYKSEEALAALSNLVPPKCNVLRSGVVSNILAEEIVPGDIIVLQTGDRVPADARIVHCTGLSVDESSLTGEAEPKLKGTRELPHLGENDEIQQFDNLVFMGTLVTSGHAKCIVTSIGIDTEFGKTFKEMQDVESKRTPLQVKMDELGKYLSIASIGIILCIGILGILQGKSFLVMFNIGVSLAVAAIPEGLPICVTVTLALGVIRMAKKNAIVKKLPAVEALGCANFICTDKTGTLTENKMEAVMIFCPAMDEKILLNSDQNFRSLGKSSGISKSDQEFNALEIFSNGFAVDAARLRCMKELLDCACLCNNSYFKGGSSTGQPTEIALLKLASTLGFSDKRDSLRRIREVSFSSETKFMEVVYLDATDTNELGYLKGALEVLLPQCSSYFGINGDIIPLNDSTRERLIQVTNEMSSEGLRVLAFCSGVKSKQLNICGVIGLMDPIRKGVVESVYRIKESGAKVMMITGDSELTAVAIAKMAGVYDSQVSNAKILSGKEIEELSQSGDNSLASIIDDVVLCYRTAPHHKVFIVRALQSKGHVVAMTGDGVNDAPALKCADIGVAMGSGTDVAKEASCMVVVDNDFSTMVSAIEEGKSIFFNIKNFLTFQLSTSIAALSLVAVNNLIGRPNPLNAM